MSNQLNLPLNLLVAGGGIGGMAAALAAARTGAQVRVLERAPELAEVGAGIQLGANAVRVLHGWGLQAALDAVAAQPTQLQARDALTGEVLGTLPLGARTVEKYGAPHLCVHRADILHVLQQAALSHGGVELKLGQCLENVLDDGLHVMLRSIDGLHLQGDALIGADGLWSQTRAHVFAEGGDAPPRVTGHLAYRAMLPQSDLPEAMRTQQVTAWLGPQLHAVQYPVRRGEWMNLVVIVNGRVIDSPNGWDHAAIASDLRVAMGDTCAALRDLVGAINHWRLWPLCDRPPLTKAAQMVRGRVALLGDAAHPMRPYLAQGAGMAIEDAAMLETVLTDAPAADLPARLQRYADARWERAGRVQARSIRNGQIFHATGPVRAARNASLKLMGERIMDVPWLYEAPASSEP